ncbi:hypothetical protein DC498_20245 [Terrimonas sp.]|uniref:DUF6728 family protein n=1 Tax=Terrimonas sp. TaxID=1914338 RepID=UPI000D51BB6C|nr:DUF6728 family protein [Terrimonas sp.]PVD50318.1 hypothetical protein DC498_20245 [Terrimonas sp.]
MKLSILQINTFETNIYLMGVWRQIAEYLYIKKKDPNREDTTWIKYMHGINRISILLFLFAIIVMMVRLAKSC